MEDHHPPAQSLNGKYLLLYFLMGGMFHTASGQESCSQGSIRLQGGTTTSGRVELCQINVWGTVCDNGWGLAEAQVACRQLGLPTTGAATNSIISVPGDTQMVWFTFIRCEGYERSIFKCNTEQSGTDQCYSSRYAGVSCQDSQAPCTQGSIRLQGGTNTSGRVEVCHINVWGQVCDDGWGFADAQVVCRQLGLPTTGAAANSVYSVPGDPVIWFEDSSCAGTESSLFNCFGKPYEISSCYDSSYAGVSCQDSQVPCTHGSIRLQGNTSGLVEVCYINVWGTICYDNWGPADAQVACRQLGLPTTGAATYSVSVVPGGTPVIWFGDSNCFGTESSLFNCNPQLYESNDEIYDYEDTNPYCSQYAGVSCKDSQAPCSQGSIRLQGNTNTSGRVEVCHINVWGTVCYSGWGLADAQVACRQLGLPTTGATTHSEFAVPGSTTVIWLRSTYCAGTESSVFNCNGRPNEINDCYRSQYAGVSCQASQAPCTQGSIRLQGSTTTRGLVEVCHLNIWGSVCADEWGLADAQVACRQLGLPTIGAATHSVTANIPVIWLMNVTCDGTESSLFNCNTPPSELNFCFRSRYAGVSCQDGSQAPCTQGSIRLQGGTNTYGHVEICRHNVWGTVCSDRWGLADAQVVCRQLGLPTTGATTHSAYPVTGSTRVIWLKTVKCTGTESNLFCCSADLIGTLCSLPDAGVSCQDSQAPCTQGSIRLQGGTNTSGRVEVCHINVWGQVCGNNWRLADAKVACRQLGLPTTGATTLPTSAVPGGTAVGWLSNIKCVGTESSLFNCNAQPSQTKCYSQNAVVNCQESQAPCTQGSIRLQGGTNTSGRVEVCHINVWGAVCDTDWGLAEAQVACRQLQLPTTSVATLVYAIPDPTRVTWLTVLQCAGTESRLFDCNARPSQTNCYSSRYSGVTCQDSQASCIQGSIRLQGGTNTSGRVEICHINVWGTVCGDGWGLADAQVACRQLGLPTTGATTLPVYPDPEGTAVSWLWNYWCNGNERSLFNCNDRPYQSYCYSFQYAGVSCQDSQAPCTQGSIRLQGGTNTSGRVEICHINVWGTVCGYRWGLADAQVACRQLRLPTTGATTLSTPVSAVPGGNAVSWLKNTLCAGNENSLFNCNSRPSETKCHPSHAGVSCQDSQAPCTQGSIRLLGGTATSGHVEVCHINVWGTVCGDDEWGLADAQVACRQLGLPTTGATALSVYAVPGGTAVSWLRNVRCAGTEPSLFNCNTQPTESNCYSFRYAGVSCQDSQTPCTEGSIRLQENTTTSGRVEVCHINIWGTVCADSAWKLIDAQVACRQLGLPTSQATTTLSVSTVLDGTRVTWLRNLNCTGTERSLFDCSASLTGNNYCYPSDAGVSCQAKRADPPAKVTASSSGPRSISLSWTYTLVEEAPVLRFIIYISNVNTSSNFTQVASPSVDDVTIKGDSYMFTVNDGKIVLPSTWYALRVIACDMFQCSDQSQQSGPLQTDHDYNLFQLQFQVSLTCSSWTNERPLGKAEVITEALTNELIKRCQCNLTLDTLITDGRFFCFPESPHHVTYRAIIHGTVEVFASGLITYLQLWVQSSVTVVVKNEVLSIEAKCPVAISSTSEAECRPEDSGTPSINRGLIGGIVGAVLLGIIMVVVVAIVVLLWRRVATIFLLKKSTSTTSKSQALQLKIQNPISSDEGYEYEKKAKEAGNVEPSTGGSAFSQLEGFSENTKKTEELVEEAR